MRLRHELFAGLVVLASTASTCLATNGLTLPKDVVLPAKVAVAIYLPKQVREFRSVFRSASGFQTTDSVQLGNTFEGSRNEYMHGKTVDATHGLGPDGVVWAKSTVDLFLNDLAHDNSVRALNDEYQAYFGGLAPAAGIATTAQP